MRKVIQIVVETDTEYAQGGFFALCSDGTIWDRTVKSDQVTENGETRTVNVRFEWQRIEGPPAE